MMHSMSAGLVESLPQTWSAYTLSPLNGSPQQTNAIQAIDDAIDALRATEAALSSVGFYFGGDGIPDIYLDSHLHQTSDLLVVGDIDLPYALRSAWNSHLAGHLPLQDVDPLFLQSLSALSQAGWFLESAVAFFGGDYHDAESIENDLKRLSVALHPSPHLTLVI